METDIFISGGGLAGMIAAIAFAHNGRRVICADPNRPVTDRTAKGADLRTTAYLQPAQALLKDIGVWRHVQAQAAALRVMRLIDRTADGGPLRKDFDADDISDAPFGWNVGIGQCGRG